MTGEALTLRYTSVAEAFNHVFKHPDGTQVVVRVRDKPDCRFIKSGDCLVSCEEFTDTAVLAFIAARAGVNPHLPAWPAGLKRPQ